ncbi:MAG: UMP kinase [Acholeplasmatales bacterium]|jgi:uridylate kinase|nr:UMP kinase [Acholeplasmatales bacterium]
MGSKRVILKLSGEALKGNGEYVINPSIVKNIATDIKELVNNDFEVGIVIGAGNIWRGKIGEELGMDRTQADFMGMIGTVMNSLALQDGLESCGVKTRVMTSISMNDVCEPYIRRKALNNFEKGYVVIFAGGTGSPYFSTDTAASLKAAELHANLILMAKNQVDGVYNKDPRKYSDAVKYDKITHKELILNKLEIMDLTASSMCEENKIDCIVFDMSLKGSMLRAANREEGFGTLVYSRVN